MALFFLFSNFSMYLQQKLHIKSTPSELFTNVFLMAFFVSVITFTVHIQISNKVGSQ